MYPTFTDILPKDKFQQDLTRFTSRLISNQNISLDNEKGPLLNLIQKFIQFSDALIILDPENRALGYLYLRAMWEITLDVCWLTLKPEFKDKYLSHSIINRYLITLYTLNFGEGVQGRQDQNEASKEEIIGFQAILNKWKSPPGYVLNIIGDRQFGRVISIIDDFLNSDDKSRVSMHKVVNNLIQFFEQHTKNWRGFTNFETYLDAVLKQLPLDKIHQDLKFQDLLLFHKMIYTNGNNAIHSSFTMNHFRGYENPGAFGFLFADAVYMLNILKWAAQAGGLLKS